MHSSEYNVENVQVTFLHNGDYSGDVILVIDGDRVEFSQPVVVAPRPGTKARAEVKIPFEVLRNFILDYTRSKAISELENADYDTLASLMLP